MQKEYTVFYEEYDSVSDLLPEDRELLASAEHAAESAYAPYSGFHVGAAVRMGDGTIVCGSNQENAAYPSGLCAERTALFAASAQHPNTRDINTLAIIGINQHGQRCEASPCGACRQVMAEYEGRQEHPLRVLCFLGQGRVRLFHDVRSLLPFGFEF